VQRVQDHQASRRRPGHLFKPEAQAATEETQRE